MPIDFVFSKMRKFEEGLRCKILKIEKMETDDCGRVRPIDAMDDTGGSEDSDDFPLAFRALVC